MRGVARNSEKRRRRRKRAEGHDQNRDGIGVAGASPGRQMLTANQRLKRRIAKSSAAHQKRQHQHQHRRAINNHGERNIVAAAEERPASGERVIER